MVVVEARQGTLDMAARGRGLTARRRGRSWSLRADSTTTKEEDEEEEVEVEQKAYIKSNNPHLTGGEQTAFLFRLLSSKALFNNDVSKLCQLCLVYLFTYVLQCNISSYVTFWLM